jgi:hypothetical protein
VWGAAGDGFAPRMTVACVETQCIASLHERRLQTSPHRKKTGHFDKWIKKDFFDKKAKIKIDVF